MGSNFEVTKALLKIIVKVLVGILLVVAVFVAIGLYANKKGKAKMLKEAESSVLLPKPPASMCERPQTYLYT